MSNCGYKRSQSRAVLYYGHKTVFFTLTDTLSSCPSRHQRSGP